eukprot:scaffold2790_cov143-Skeletonema_marinoi.AAC.2
MEEVMKEGMCSGIQRDWKGVAIVDDVTLNSDDSRVIRTEYPGLSVKQAFACLFSVKFELMKRNDLRNKLEVNASYKGTEQFVSGRSKKDQGRASRILLVVGSAIGGPQDMMPFASIGRHPEEIPCRLAQG